MSNSKIEDFREKETDYFAMCLIMPRHLVIETIKNKGFNLNLVSDIKKLASIFDVTVTLMTMRLTQLELLEPSAYI